MAQRLTTYMSTFYRILKNGLFTGKLNNIAQVQPRYSEFRQFLSQSSVCSSPKPPKALHEPLLPWRSNLTVVAQIQGKSTGEEKEIDKTNNSASSSAPPPDIFTVLLTLSSEKATLKVTISPPKWEVPEYDDAGVNVTLAFAGFVIFWGFWRSMKQTYKEINDLGNRLARAGVAKLKDLDGKLFQNSTAPGVDVSKTENEAPVANKMKVRPERDFRLLNQQNLRFCLRTPFFSYTSYWPPAGY